MLSEFKHAQKYGLYAQGLCQYFFFFRLSPLLYSKLSFEFGRQENKNESTPLLITVVLPVTGGFEISPFNPHIKLLVFITALKPLK